MPLANGGTFQPLQHRTGTLRERLHSYTKRTLGAGGSINEAVRQEVLIYCLGVSVRPTRLPRRNPHLLRIKWIL